VEARWYWIQGSGEVAGRYRLGRVVGANRSGAARAMHLVVWLFGAATWLTRGVNHRSRCIHSGGSFLLQVVSAIPGEQTAVVEYLRRVPHYALKVAGEIPALQCRDREGAISPTQRLWGEQGEEDECG